MAEIALGAAGLLVYGAAAAAQTGLSVWSLLTKERPTGLHRTSHYTFDTMSRISKDVDAVQKVIDNFAQVVQGRISPEQVDVASQFVRETKQILHLIHSQLSTTDSHKLAIAFQYFRLLLELTQEPLYTQCWQLLGQVRFRHCTQIMPLSTSKPLLVSSCRQRSEAWPTSNASFITDIR